MKATRAVLGGALEPRGLDKLGKRDADRELYRATHKNKKQRDRERRAMVIGYTPVSGNKGMNR